MLSLNIRNDFLQVKEQDYYTAIAKYNMTEQMVQESIESIRQWYKMQPHLPEGALTDDRLFRHMLVVGFSMEKLKTKIDNMFTARSILPELMADRDPTSQDIQELRHIAVSSVLPQRLDDMTRVFAIAVKGNPTAANLQAAMKGFFIICDYLLTADISVGEHFIVDFKNMKLGHIIGITPSLVKKFMFIYKKCFESKIKGVHYVNVPSYCMNVVFLIKAVLSKKMADRIHVHNDYESLHRIISKDILPSDFGGPNKSLQEYSDEFHDEICKPEWCQWLVNQDRLTSDESKRLGKAKDMSSELLGIQGSYMPESCSEATELCLNKSESDLYKKRFPSSMDRKQFDSGDETDQD